MIDQAELFRTVAPFLGQGDLFQPTPSAKQRTVEACGLMRDGALSSRDTVDEIAMIGGPILRPSRDHIAGILSEPTWSLRLVLAWMLGDGDLERVVEAYDHALTWRLSLDAHPDWRDAYQTLRSALLRGRLTATGLRPGEARATIAAEDWNALYPLNSGGAVTLSKRGQNFKASYIEVRFDAAAVKAFWKPASRARSKSGATIKTQRAVVKTLTAMMSVDRQNPIPKVRVRAFAEFTGVSKRMFDGAWSAAVNAAEAPAWSAAGRRAKARPSPPPPT